MGEVISNTRAGMWMAQKYIENPLLVEGRKFDIRQWVLVTSWDPLAVWFYDDSYLRFCFNKYNPDNPTNRFAHLTNNSISKKSKRYNEDTRDATMWHSDEFADFLRKQTWASSAEDPDVTTMDAETIEGAPVPDGADKAIAS